MPDLLRLPEVSANLVDAAVGEWLVEDGARFYVGDPIVVVETDKASVEVAAESDGVLVRRLVDVGVTLPVGSAIAVVSAVDEPATAIEEYLATITAALDGADQVPASPPPEPDAQAGTAEIAASPSGAGADAQPPRVPGGGRVFSSPLARRLAKEAALDVTTVAGSGPGGRVRRIDVLEAIADGAKSVPAQPVVEAGGQRDDARFVDVPLTPARRAIARRLSESKQEVPHFYLRASANCDRLLALRQEINSSTGAKVTINDFLIKAIAHAHALVPDLNVAWTGDAVRHFESVDVGVAVATEFGVVTPVVRGVDAMSLATVAATSRDLAERARIKRLREWELAGGSISVSNLGMFGIEEFAAIINPPQASVLAVGAAVRRPSVVGEAIQIASQLKLTLSIDHRPVDGSTAAEWMQAFVDLLENPFRIYAA